MGRLRTNFLGCCFSSSAVDADAHKRVTSKEEEEGGDGTIYFDTSDGGDSFDEFFETLQKDGQYFFDAKDDPAAFGVIHMYPPLRTTMLDPPPRSPISLTNPETLLCTYQHSADDLETEKSHEEANLAAEKVGVAMENQAKRMSMIKPNQAESSEYLGRCTALLLEEVKEVKEAEVMTKGFPGGLTETELEAVMRFRSELKTRDPIYGQIVRALSAVEKESYALCRWLRARKFDVDKVFELLDEARPHYNAARENDFYPELEKALGFSRPVFLSQYPAVYCGNARNGCPVMYMRAGLVQPDGINCLASIDNVGRFFWNDTMFAWVDILKEARRANSQFERTESITVYDLKGVSRSQVTSDAFEVVKMGNQVMSAFPETLHCLLIINAPGWFGFVWSGVKKMIDPRTASKIEVFSSTKAGIKRMEELIDNSQIPSDYGGTGRTLAEAASGGGMSDGKKNEMVSLNHLLNIPKKNAEKSYSFDLDDAKEMTLTVYTRCKAGATASVFSGDAETLLLEIDITGDNNDEPYSRTIGAIEGPGKFMVKLKAKTQPGVFLVLGTTAATG